MVDIRGYNGKVVASSLKVFNAGRTQNDWNGWNEIYNVEVGNCDGRLEAQLSLTEVLPNSQPEVSIHLQDVLGNEDFSDNVISPSSPGTLTITQTPIAPDIIDLDNYFIDPDNDAIFFSFGYSHLEIKIHENHSVDIASLAEWTGLETVTFRATDPFGAMVEDTILVTVLPVNDRPEITEIPIQYGEIGKMWRLDLALYIHDVDNNISELSISVDNKNVFVSGSKLVFYGSEELSGNLTLMVSDGDLTCSHNIKVVITSPPEDKEKEPNIDPNIFIWLLMLMVGIIVILDIISNSRERKT